MTTFLLIRHGSHDLLGKSLAGRASGVLLNERGEREAENLVMRLGNTQIDAVYSSPRERTLKTAAPLSAKRSLEVREHPGLDEIDFGDWTGKSFTELERHQHWPTWVNRRSSAQPPNGETITAACERAVRVIHELARQHHGEVIALFSHGDVIKSVLAHHLGTSLDELERFEISPASISVLIVGDNWSRVTLLNDTGTFSGTAWH